MKIQQILDVDEVAVYIYKRLKKDYDAVIAITGIEGVGKSTLLILLSMAVARLNKTSWKIQDNIIMNHEEIVDRIKNMRQFSSIGIDEAMRALYKRGWNSAERQSLNTLFAECRQRNLCIFLALPNFWDLDAYYRKHRVYAWIHVIDRGKAVIVFRDKNPFNVDPWNQKANMRWFSKETKNSYIPNKEAFEFMIKCPMNNPIGINFNKLTGKIEDEYLSMKKDYFKQLKQGKIEDLPKMAERWKGRYIELSMHQLIEHGDTQAHIANNSNISKPELCEVLPTKQLVIALNK